MNEDTQPDSGSDSHSGYAAKCAIIRHYLDYSPEVGPSLSSVPQVEAIFTRSVPSRVGGFHEQIE